MKKNYNFCVIEKKIQKYLKKNKLFFHQDDCIKKNCFCIMVPPPNITGYLHMGHAFQQTIMDVLIRYNRMLKKKVLLQMGTDHAGIATQMVVERQLLIKEGKRKNEYTRDMFIEKILKWKKKSELIMFNQIKKLGHFINWDSVRFTLDSNFSSAVKKAFITLYKDGLIYRRKKLVHWDPKLQTVVSDLEVKNKVVPGKMWYYQYFLINKKNNSICKKSVTVATTRPETLLGDTALAVNPIDKRYTKYIGKFVLVPIIKRIIPIIGDKSIDVNKGTGCMKVTPAHDFYDYEIGINHQLPMINIFQSNGKILKKLNIFNYQGHKIKIFNDSIPKKLQNQDRFIARKIILSILKKKNFLKKSVSYNINIPYGDRSNVILEPMLTDQWYLNARSLSKQAIQAVKEKKIVFVPKQYKNMYLSWMYNIQDWCISRQLWWGHRLPVWYDSETNVYVGNNEATIRKEYGLKKHVKLIQDNDVLDTWFSSSLWTFAGLGWPRDLNTMNFFHPTDVLVCGFDIIFFWIARMIMMTMYFITDKNGYPQVPFKTVYITGLIRDEVGKKMSKSHGNVLDPIDMIDGISLKKLIKKRTNNSIYIDSLDAIKNSTIKNFPKGIPAHSTDALRYTFLSLASTSRNINWDMNRLKGYQYFCNKIWNASCFVIKHTKKTKIKKLFSGILLSDQWIYMKLNDVFKKYHYFLKSFRFDSLSVLLYKFVWNKFCDQYLEMIKPILKYGSSYEIFLIKNTMFYILSNILLLIHPIMPFITIYIWNVLQRFKKIFHPVIILNVIPSHNKQIKNVYIIKFMNWFQKVLSILRIIRVDAKIKYNTLLNVCFKNLTVNKKIFFQENNLFLKKMAYIKNIIEIKKYKNIPSAIIRIVDGVEIFILIDSFLDIRLELQRLEKKITLLNKQIKDVKKLLLNKKFLIHAPSDVIVEKKSLLKNNIVALKRISKQKKILLKKNF